MCLSTNFQRIPELFKKFMILLLGCAMYTMETKLMLFFYFELVFITWMSEAAPHMCRTQNQMPEKEDVLCNMFCEIHQNDVGFYLNQRGTQNHYSWNYTFLELENIYLIIKMTRTWDTSTTCHDLNVFWYCTIINLKPWFTFSPMFLTWHGLSHRTIFMRKLDPSA